MWWRNKQRVYGTNCCVCNSRAIYVYDRNKGQLTQGTPNARHKQVLKGKRALQEVQLLQDSKN